MDSPGFDALTRRVFAVTSRRAAFASLASVLAILTGLLAPNTGTARRRPRVCRPLGGACFPERGIGCCGNAACRQGKCRCGPSQRSCRGRCINKNRCCRNRDCDGGQRCQSGRCLCPSGQRKCGKRCAAKGACCPGETTCGGRCVNTRTAKRHCGKCGLACAGTATCKNGVCVAGGTYRLVRRWGTADEWDPYAITVDQAGMLYVTESSISSFTDRVVKFTGDGDFVTSWSAGGDAPWGIDITPAGVVYVVTQVLSDQVHTFTNDGTPGLAFDVPDLPRGVAIGSNGDVYIAFWIDKAVRRYTLEGVLIETWTGAPYRLTQPNWVAGAPNGDIYVTNLDPDEVIWLSATGTVKGWWGRFGSDNGQLSSPNGITVDAAGFVYVTFRENGEVQKFTASGGFVGVIGDVTMFQIPTDVAVSPSGMLYVTDAAGGEIVQFVPA